MRVVIAGLPMLLKGIVANIASEESGIELVEIPAAGDLAKQLCENGADVLVTAAPPDSGPIVAMLDANPRLRVITILERGQAGWLWEMRPHCEPLGELTVAGLTRALKRRETAETPLQSSEPVEGAKP